FAGPLLAAGGLLALVGVILYLLAVDHDRRGPGPRRGRKGPLLGIRDLFTGRGRKTENTTSPTDAKSPQGALKHRAMRRIALPSLGLAVVLGVSGCSADYWPDFSPEAQ